MIKLPRRCYAIRALFDSLILALIRMLEAMPYHAYNESLTHCRTAGFVHLDAFDGSRHGLTVSFWRDCKIRWIQRDTDLY